MLRKLLKNKGRLALLLLFFTLLAAIRAYEDILFYDPFLDYFKTNYIFLLLPKIDSLQLFLGFLFRYFLNTILSLAMIYTLYKDVDMIKFASGLYLILFLILVAAFFFVFSYFGEANKMGLFYIRRFLIQPIFLLLFVPAFYYQKQMKR
jgi:exosortase F-associated protein